MQFSLDHNEGSYQIDGYAPGQVTVNEQVLRTSLVISPDRLQIDWPLRDIKDLTEGHVQELAGWEPEILLLGTGIRQCFPNAALLAQFLGRGIGVEVMDTAAACRTYNVLNSERRRVVAALLLG